MTSDNRDLGAMKATEDATRKNIQAILDYSKQTRVITKTNTEQVAFLSRKVDTLEALLDTQRLQIAALRAQVLGGGRTVPDAPDS